MYVFKRKRKVDGRATESRQYYGQLTRADGKVERVTLYSSKEESQRELVRLQNREDQKRRGTLDPFEEPMRWPLTKHVEDFEAHLSSTFAEFSATQPG